MLGLLCAMGISLSTIALISGRTPYTTTSTSSIPTRPLPIALLVTSMPLLLTGLGRAAGQCACTLRWVINTEVNTYAYLYSGIGVSVSISVSIGITIGVVCVSIGVGDNRMIVIL